MSADQRPENCRFRLQDEGKSYPRSSCTACGRTITTGLGRRCHYETNEIEAFRASALAPTVSGELVATVIWYDPKSDMLLYERPQKIIDGSVAFMKDAPLGTKLYTHPSPTRAEVLEEAARFIEAHCEVNSNFKDKYLAPRRYGDVTALAYAAGLRALAGEKP